MSEIIPHPYQLSGINQLIRYIGQGYKRVVFQLPCGGGKTVCYSLLLQRYFKAYAGHIAKVLVHRDTLLRQGEKTLKRFNINNVPVVMIETFCNRLKDGMFTNTKIIIIDECHLGNFRKIFEHFPDAIIIGFTATPVSASKKHPLNADYEQIVVCTSVQELINIHDINPSQGLVRPMHYQPSNEVIKSNIQRSGADYNMRSMSNELSKPKLIDSVIANYVRFGEHKKTVVFNSLVDHSKKVHDCFISHGYNSRHLDGSMSDSERKEIYHWFSNTPDAILNSVDMATTGFDEPSIINVIPNRLTLSWTLWDQMAGRGSRPYPGKNYFNIIDTVGNIEKHGRWDFKHDFYSMFHHPAKSGTGPPPMKTCINPLCNAMIYMSSTKCEYCGQLYPRETIYSDMVVELQLVPDDLQIVKPTIKKFDRHAAKIAENVKHKPVELNERRDVMEEAVKKLALQSDFKLSSNMITHLASKHL